MHMLTYYVSNYFFYSDLNCNFNKNKIGLSLFMLGMVIWLTCGMTKKAVLIFMWWQIQPLMFGGDYHVDKNWRRKKSPPPTGTYRRTLESFRVSTNNKSKGVTIKKCSRVYLVWYLTIRNIFGHYFLINVQKTSSQLKWPILKINCQIKVASTIYLKKISLYVKVLLYEIVIQIIPYKFLTVQRPFAFIPTSSLDLIIYLVHTIDAAVRYLKPESEMPALWYLNPNPTLKNGTRTPTWQEFWLLLYTTFLIPGPDRT